MKITRPLRGVVHLHFGSQKQLATAMIRMQEFYESPYAEIRGKFFKLDKFERLYCADHGRPFSYYTDWHGFNIPGPVLREFAKTFSGRLAPVERSILAIQDLKYLIATHSDAEVPHELAHAMYSIDSYYQAHAKVLVQRFSKFYPEQHAALRKWLLREGYHESVLIDEMNAYLATNEEADWHEDFSAKTSAVLLDAGRVFAQEFKDNKLYLIKTSEEHKLCLIEIKNRSSGIKLMAGHSPSVLAGIHVAPKAGVRKRRTGTTPKPSPRSRASARTAR